jgi:hypothetical protein
VSDIDAYFTQSIVGAPFSAALGRRAAAASERNVGVEIATDGTVAQLKGFWRDEVLIGASAAGPFLRRIPSPQRRWLERHALVFALLGLASGGLSGLYALWVQLS